MSFEREPQALLDAIADDPDAPGPWRVLADWLLERGVPHGVLAAYELKLEKGTNDPDLIETWAEQRALRMRPPPEAGLGFGEASWRCGYITRLVLLLARYRDVDWEAFFSAPALRTLSWLQLNIRPASLERGRLTLSALEADALSRRNAIEKRETLELVLRWAPPTLRRISVFTEGPLEAEVAALEPLLEVRPGVRRLDLALRSALGTTLPPFGSAGYELLNFDGTRLDVGTARALVSRATRGLVLGGTGLTGREAAELDQPGLRWCAPDVDAAIVAADGKLHPLSNNAAVLWHHPSMITNVVQPSPWGWQHLVWHRRGEGAELEVEADAIDLEDGSDAPGMEGGRVLVGGDLDARYRQLLRSFAPPPPDYGDW